MISPSPLPFDLDSGRYSVLRHVGSGGFGEVYEAFDNDQSERVAIKLLQPGVLIDEVVREAANQAKLRGHDHIVELRNVRTIPPRSFLVMEFLPYDSAEGRFKSGTANLIEIVRWIRNGLDGLAFAHGQNIIHRDFKPGNLMLAENGTAKLSDFGVAEDTIKGHAVAKLYNALWAPELLAGAHTSVQTDIWAVGCTLYFLLTGHYPFGMPIDVKAVNAGTYEPIHVSNPQVPMRVVRVVERALAVDPADRFGTAWEMLSQLLDCDVHRAWRRYSDPTAVESWESCDNGTPLRGTVSPRSRGGFDVVVRRQAASGGWRAIPGESRRIPTVGNAKRTLGNWMRGHVQTPTA